MQDIPFRCSQRRRKKLQYKQLNKKGIYELRDFNLASQQIVDEQGLMMVGGLGWYRFNDQGIATQEVQSVPNCPSGFSYVNPVEDTIAMQYAFGDVNCAAYDDGLVFYPVIQYMGYEYKPEYKAKYETLIKKDYGLSTHNNESGKPQIMVFAADPQTIKSRPVDDPENTSYVPDELKILNTIGSTPDFYTEQYYKGQFNDWLRQTLFTLDREQNLAYITAITDSLIYIYDYQGERVGQFPKVGHDRNAFKFFSLAEDQTYKGEKITRKNVRRWSASNYGMSTTENQIFHDPRKNYLYRVVLSPGEKQTYEQWAALYDAGASYMDAINLHKQATLQIYDLNNGGKMIAEQPVSPYFRMLEIDKNGLLWAITGVKRDKKDNQLVVQAFQQGQP